MRIFRRARTIKRFLYSPISIVVLIVLLVFLFKAVIGAYTNEQKSTTELKNARQNAEELGTREAFLSNEIERLGSSRGLEEELRTKFPVAREGEHVVIIVEPTNDTSMQTGTERKGFWSRILDIFR